MAETAMTKLEAVNILLKTIGETPINTLLDNGLNDASNAEDTLDEINREVQQEGWRFNTEIDYPLLPDTNGEIYIAPNVLTVIPVDRCVDIVMRGSRLYDRENKTYTFSDTLKANLTLVLPFEELPQEARYYITIRASRVFANRELGDNATYSYTREDENMALVNLNRIHARKLKGTMIKGRISSGILRYTNRRGVY